MSPDLHPVVMEDDTFFDKSTSDEQWFLNKILEGRFELLENDTMIYDKVRNLHCSPGINTDFENKYKLPCFAIKKHRNKVRYMRMIKLHRFIYIFHSKMIIPNTHYLTFKDKNYRNTSFTNLELVPKRCEESDFYDANLTDTQWFYNKIMEDRFKLSNNSMKIFDTTRDIWYVFGKNCAKNHYISFNIKSTIPYEKRRNIPIHCFIWMCYNRKIIPQNYEIHHRDYNKQNNHIDNLELITEKDHKSLHGTSCLYTARGKQKRAEVRELYDKLKQQYCFKYGKLCAKCARFLPFFHFGKWNNPKLKIKLKSHCRQCRSVMDYGYGEIYQFSLGVLNDKIIMDIRFLFNIVNRSFYKIQNKYPDISKQDLKDIILGNTYIHLPLLHGIHDTPYRNEKYINQIEHCHIQNTYKQAGFAPEELAKIYGRSLGEIHYVLIVGNYKPVIEMVKDVMKYVKGYLTQCG